MKKMFFVLALVIASLPFNSFAQKAKSKASVGVTGGITMANQYGSKAGQLIKDDQKLGFTLGLTMDAPIGKTNFSFQPGLFYAQKGRIENVSFREKTYWSLRYAELQANFLYSVKSDKGYTFFVGGGPTFAADLPSFAETRLLDADPLTGGGDEFVKSGSRSVSWGTTAASDFKGPDWGVNMMIGLRGKCGWSVGYNYTVGLRNIMSVASGNDAIRNHFMGLRLSYWVKNK
jgi:hypothetical protein